MRCVRAAVLMDEFRETDAAAPRRPVLWQRVVKQTEASRLLLESWLLSSAPAPAIGEVWDIEIP